jgi:peptide deformylase
MSKKNLAIYPDPILRKMSAPVIFSIDNQKNLTDLLSDLQDTLLDPKSPSGFGLSAVQIGILWRVFIMAVPCSDENAKKFPNARSINDRYLIEFINPSIEIRGEPVLVREGCLSIPGYSESLRVAPEAKITYSDVNGQEHTVECSGLTAICAQHEMDHLNGILYIDRMSRLKRGLFNSWINKKVKKQKRIMKQMKQMIKAQQKLQPQRTDDPKPEQHGTIGSEAAPI